MAPENLVGQMVAVRILSATANSLLGEVSSDKLGSNSQLEGNMA